MKFVCKVHTLEIKEFKNNKKGLLIGDGSKKKILCFVPDSFDLPDIVPTYDLYAIVDFYSVKSKTSGAYIDTFQFDRFFNSSNIDICNLFGVISSE